MTSLKISVSNKKIRSPLNYVGGKYKILDQIIPLFPSGINTFLDLFSGGCNVGINANANKIIFNDNLSYLIAMLKEFQDNSIEATVEHIKNRIEEFDLSITNESGFKRFRGYYNQKKCPLDLFVLIAFSFNHQIRFNNSQQFNCSFGKERSQFNATMQNNLETFIIKLKETETVFLSHSFEKFDYSTLSKNDFVYCDPPYLITTGSYNDGKRGFKGWTEKEELELLDILDSLNKQGVKFALSNVITHKGSENFILKRWLKARNYITNIINKNYSNSNYQTKIRDKNASTEVLITNYTPSKEQQQLDLFDF